MLTFDNVPFICRARFHTTMRSTSLDVNGNSPTQPGAWLEMINTLKSNDVTFINPHEVKISQDKGVSVLDVRTAKQYEQVCSSQWAVDVNRYGFIPENTILLYKSAAKCPSLVLLALVSA